LKTTPKYLKSVIFENEKNVSPFIKNGPETICLKKFIKFDVNLNAAHSKVFFIPFLSNLFVTRSQSYKTKVVLKKSKLVLNSVTLFYVNLHYTNVFFLSKMR